MKELAKGIAQMLAIVLGIFLALGATLYFVYMRTVSVGTDAMAPTLLAGDQVLVWEHQEFDLGDVVLCPHPRAEGRYIIARVIGRAGQQVVIERGQVRLDNRVLDRDIQGEVPYTDVDTNTRQRMRWGFEEIADRRHKWMERLRREPQMNQRRVESGVFVLSDNRAIRGQDSRFFGDVAPDTCIGEVFLRLSAADGPDAFRNAALDFIQ